MKRTTREYQTLPTYTDRVLEPPYKSMKYTAPDLFPCVLRTLTHQGTTYFHVGDVLSMLGWCHSAVKRIVCHYCGEDALYLVWNTTREEANKRGTYFIKADALHTLVYYSPTLKAKKIEEWLLAEVVPQDQVEMYQNGGERYEVLPQRPIKRSVAAHQAAMTKRLEANREKALERKKQQETAFAMLNTSEQFEAALRQILPNSPSDTAQALAGAIMLAKKEDEILGAISRFKPCDHAVSLEDFWGSLNIRASKAAFYDLLKQEGHLLASTGRNSLPCQAAIQNGILKMQDSKKGERTYATVVVTPKGQELIAPLAYRALAQLPQLKSRKCKDAVLGL